ncbi:MAG: ribosome silencing factor [Oscillospiraceae bacterium]|jgi:ribosome-associated protein|nr:ribosome silencing factor [Oscillospiraceae bacterium]
MTDAKEIALCAAMAMDDKKGQDILVLEVGRRTVIADYMVIASGRAVPQVKAMLDAVEEKLAQRGVLPRRREGAAEGRWAVLDYGSVLVHIFHEQERAYYQLERLWQDVDNVVPLPEAPQNL